jgi:hypothetical protein
MVKNKQHYNKHITENPEMSQYKLDLMNHHIGKQKLVIVLLSLIFISFGITFSFKPVLELSNIYIQ